MGHGQTVQIQISHRIMRCLIRIFTVCLQDVLLKFEEKKLKNTNTPKIGNGQVLQIMVGKSIRHKWVNDLLVKSHASNAD